MNLKYAACWHIHISVHSVLWQCYAQAHTHPQTIWGQRANGVKSGYCQDALQNQQRPCRHKPSKLPPSLWPQDQRSTKIGSVQKNPLKIRKLFTNLFTKPGMMPAIWCGKATQNYATLQSAHPVKGRNPYCSRWFLVISHGDLYFIFNCSVLGNAVSDWYTDSLSLGLWRPHNSQTFTDPTQFAQTFKTLKNISHFSQTFKDLQRLCKPWKAAPGTDQTAHPLPLLLPPYSLWMEPPPHGQAISSAPSLESFQSTGLQSSQGGDVFSF